MKNWSVGVRSMLAKLKHDNYDSLGEIDSAIEDALQELMEAKQYMRDLYLKKASCAHVYRPATYSIQRRLLGYVRVNERACKSCGHTELLTENEEGTNRPSWAVEATKTHYNNDI